MIGAEVEHVRREADERERQPPPAWAAPLRGYPADSSGPGYRHSAALDRSQRKLSGWRIRILGLTEAVAPNKKISEFSTRRSAIAVAMVVLKSMLPQSENGVLVVMMVERFWLWRMEIT